MTKGMRIGIVLALFLGTIAFTFLLDSKNEALRQPRRYAFPDLQNATNTTDAAAILESWDKTGVNDQVKASMKLDLLFPFFYAPLIALLCRYASLRRPTAWVARLGPPLAIAAIVSGLCDLAENGIMLWMVGDPANVKYLPLMMVFTWGKIVLLVVSSWYVVLSHLDS